MAEVHTCAVYKVAEIVCVALEAIVESELFKSIPKRDSFIVEVLDRSSKKDPTVYPFQK